jgi:hypothetical protein
VQFTCTAAAAAAENATGNGRRINEIMKRSEAKIFSSGLHHSLPLDNKRRALLKRIIAIREEVREQRNGKEEFYEYN